MIRGRRKLPKPKKVNKKFIPPGPQKRYDIRVKNKDNITLKAWWLPNNGLSCPHCCLGSVKTEEGYKCYCCGSVVMKVEEAKC